MRKEYATAFLDSPYFSILDKQTNIYGWPLLQELEGSIYIDGPKALGLPYMEGNASFNPKIQDI